MSHQSNKQQANSKEDAVPVHANVRHDADGIVHILNSFKCARCRRLWSEQYHLRSGGVLFILEFCKSFFYTKIPQF